MNRLLTEREKRYRQAIREKLANAKLVLDSATVDDEGSPAEWYSALNELKQTLGNINNDISFIVTLLAKLYLKKRFGLFDFDAAAKPQGAPGLDIDEILPDSRRVVCEIKTTTPYIRSDFGAQQKTSFDKDFRKLADAEAGLKFMFVTEDATFKILCRPRYAAKLSGVAVVQLISEEEHAIP